MAKRKLFHLLLTAVCVTLFNLPFVTRAEKIPSIPKWQKIEITLKSSIAYTNALQEAEMRVLFVSPLGETNRVYGFWEGGKTWRVRYKPTFPGRWTYYTMCSDTANKGLHGQTGTFLCTASKIESRFAEHGPVSVARDQQHLEHADRSPFLWLGDAAWYSAIKSTPTDWSEYVKTRASQKFNTIQWRLNPAGKESKQTAFTGRDSVKLNLDFLRQLDKKVESANRAGLLNAIAPLWEIGSNTDDALPEDQAIVLLRHCIARWGADDVAWIVAFECDTTSDQASRWQRIGRAVFNSVSHAPVVLVPGESVWALDAFRRERWVDVLGIQTIAASDENSLPWLLNGPISLERHKQPLRPLITISPPAEVEASAAKPRQLTSDVSRHLMWWSLLLNTPAGVSYCSKDVSDWNTTSGRDAAPQPWRQALTLPGATWIGPLADCFSGKDFWKLEPFPQALTVQPGLNSARSHVAAASTVARDIAMFYVPENGSVLLSPRGLTTKSNVTWFDPRTGESRPASAAANTNLDYRFTTPTNGDWLLVFNKAK